MTPEKSSLFLQITIKKDPISSHSQVTNYLQFGASDLKNPFNHLHFLEYGMRNGTVNVDDRERPLSRPIPPQSQSCDIYPRTCQNRPDGSQHSGLVNVLIKEHRSLGHDFEPISIHLNNPGMRVLEDGSCRCSLSLIRFVFHLDKMSVRPPVHLTLFFKENTKLPGNQRRVDKIDGLC